MSKYHNNDELPKMGAKIEYAKRFNDVNISVYGEYDEMGLIAPHDLKIGLSDFIAWNDVLIWCYIDIDYNYGKTLHNLIAGKGK